MGRASTITLLPLDRFAAILGIEPRHFNGIVSAYGPEVHCGSRWLQYSWQSLDRVSREEVAMAIEQAERDVMDLLGYSLIPRWQADEVHRTPPPADRALVHGGLYNARSMFPSVTANWGHVICGGIRSNDDLGGPFAVTYPGGGGYDETGTVTVPGVTFTDTNQVRVYFEGEGGNDEWEIRPLRSVTISGGTLTIVIDKHLLADPDLWEALQPEDIDGDNNANFVTQVEVYRVSNDQSQMAQLQWERTPGTCDCGSSTCAMCAWEVQWACLQTRNPELGFVTYQPGTWNATDEQYDSATLAVARRPERVRLWYYAGWRSDRVARPYVEMDPMLERMVAYYALTLLDRIVCGCDNVEALYKRWTVDRALVAEDSNYQLSPRDLDCPWGTREGAIAAYKRLQPLALGR